MAEQVLAGSAMAPDLVVGVGRAEARAVSSAVSWGAVFAGAAGAAALSLILLVLGMGLGLSSVSPFSGQGLGGTAFGWSTILWVTFTQLAASGMGGYLAGRLRARWSANEDEVYFRDTAHGFLAWAVATLITAATLTSAIGSIVGAGAQAAGTVAAGVASTATTAAAAGGGAAAGRMESTANSGYFIDSLFRGSAVASPDASASTAGSAGDTQQGASRGSSAEIGRIFANAMATGALPPDDATYTAQVVAQRTGMSTADAQKRVTDTFTRMQTQAKEAEAAAKDAADKARKASAYAALWLFISLLAGAFVASFTATYGGRRRDLI